MAFFLFFFPLFPRFCFALKMLLHIFEEKKKVIAEKYVHTNIYSRVPTRRTFPPLVRFCGCGLEREVPAQDPPLRDSYRGSYRG